MSHHYLIGQTLENKYYILSLLGRGGMAEVFLAQTRDGTQVAVKVLQNHLLTNPGEIEAFKREATRIYELHHPNIVPLIDWGHTFDAKPYFVMPKADGDLKKFTGHQLSLAQVVDFVTKIAAALQHAHDTGIVHRDLKPANVLFAYGHIWVSDFGIATESISIKPKTQELAGTSAYIAPEQFRGKARRASDQYALAVMTYEWLAGERPFQSDNYAGFAYHHVMTPPPDIRAVRPDLSGELAEIIRRGLAKEAGERFGSVREFADTLEAEYLRLTQQQEPTFHKLPETTPLPDAASIARDTSHSAREFAAQGYTFYEQGKFQDAIVSYEQAIKLGPNSASLYNNKGVVLDKLGRSEEAITAFDQAIELDPNYAYAYHKKGVALVKLGRYEEAITVYDQAIKLDPNHASSYYNKGVALVNLGIYKGSWGRLGIYEEAIVCFDQAIMRDPNYAYAYNGKGLALENLGRHKEAEEFRNIAKSLKKGS